MTIGERIKNIREKLGITQEEFSQRLGTTRNTITNYEANRRMPMDATIKSICREFNVSEAWLRTGDGEMFVRREPQPLEALLVEMLGAQNVTDGDRVLMKNFLELSDASRQEVIAFVRRCAQELSQAPAEVSKAETTTSPDIAARMTELERQNKEKDKQIQALAAKVAAMEEEDAAQTAGRTG